MKHHYVKTSNHQAFEATIGFSKKAARGAKNILISGEPGTGKTTTVDYYGAENNAIYIDGLPGMSLSYIKELIAYELSAKNLRGLALQQHIEQILRKTKQPIILDEAQHGLSNKAEIIDYLRRITEKVDTQLILVCHNSEKHRFAEHNLAHIATRISEIVDFKPANLADCQLYLNELCEINTDEGIAKQVLSQSEGRYRLMVSAVNTLESVAEKMGKTSLTGADTKDFVLCENAMRSLQKRGAK